MKPWRKMTEDEQRTSKARSRVRWTLRSPKSRRFALDYNRDWDTEVRVTEGRNFPERIAAVGRQFRPDRPNLSHRIREVWFGWHHDLPAPMVMAVFYCNGRSYDLGSPDPGAEECRRCEFNYREKEQRDQRG